MHRRLALLMLTAGLFTACGEAAPSPSARPTVSQAFANPPELLEMESLSTRQSLFKDVARTSLGQSNAAADGLVLFPLLVNGEYRAAPALDARVDLLQGADAGATTSLDVDVATEARWPEARHESLQGLSEREAAELVARSLLSRWQVTPHSAVRVERAEGVPYAAAYVDGVLRINPAFIYLAAAASAN